MQISLYYTVYKYNINHKFVICIKIIATANIKLMTVLSVGISPINNQANKPNIKVPTPNPANLIFQNAPKCS